MRTIAVSAANRGHPANSRMIYAIRSTYATIRSPMTLINNTAPGEFDGSRGEISDLLDRCGEYADDCARYQKLYSYS